MGSGRRSRRFAAPTAGSIFSSITPATPGVATSSSSTTRYGESGFALKFFGYVRMCRALWPMLKESHGSVINIVGTGALTPGPRFAIGGSVNAAVANFSKALANLGLVDDVNVNVVHPGTVAETDRYETVLARNAEAQGLERDEAERRSLVSQGIRRFALPADVATVAAFLASPLARQIQGVQAIVDGGSTKGL